MSTRPAMVSPDVNADTIIESPPSAVVTVTQTPGGGGTIAAVTYDANVTPDVIFGSGNSNGLFTVDHGGGVELGLRAKIPFNGIVHSNGDGTYSYTLAELLAAFPDQRWNFDWTVNTDWNGSSGVKIDDLTYLLQLDFDPSQGTDFVEFDPITPTVDIPFYDHSIGDNTTANGGGVEAGDAVTYAGLIAANNVAQQSWRYAFFPIHPTLTYDATVDGTYDVILSAYDGSSTLVASTSIQVIVGAGGAPVTAYVDDDWTSQADVDSFDPTLVWQFDAFATIQPALDAVAGSTVYVAAGTYPGNLSVPASVLLKSISGASATTIAGAGGCAVTVGGDGVTVDGFTITNATGSNAICSVDHSTIDIRNNLVTNVGSVAGTTNVHAVVIVSSAAAVTDVSIVDNQISNIRVGPNKSNSAITIGHSTGAEDVTGLVIQGNAISDVVANTSAWPVGHGAYGILLSHGSGTTGKTVNAEIRNNTITNLEGLWAHGIGLEGNTPGALVLGNDISFLVDHKVPSDAVAIQVEANASADTVCIHLNRFSNLNVGVQNAVSPVLLVDAEDNWWGDASGPSGVGSGGGAAVTANVDYDPWAPSSAVHLAAGGNRLVALQNDDGGWDWPLDDGNPANASPKNTIGPIGRGLARAYRETGDPDAYAALEGVALFLQAKTNNFSPSDGYLAAELDSILGGTANVDHVVANFYDPLAAGTYNRNGAGTLYDTAAYVALIQNARHGSGIGNLAAWDIGMGLVGAASVGADTAAWIAGVKAEIDLLDGDGYYDVIGLAGAVFSLAFVGEDFDPTAGEHAAASNLNDLAAILAGYQIVESGGFTWNSNYVIPYDFNETIQESSYAILALLEIGGFTSEVASAVDYMKSVQLCTGGWANYVGGGENNEITAEALWAMGLPIRNVDTGQLFATIQSAIDDPATLNGHTLEVVPPVHSEGAVTVNKSLTLRGGSVDTIKMAADTGASGDARGWFLVDTDVTLHVADLIFDGNGHLVYQAFRHKGNGSFTNCTFRDIKYNESGPTYGGVAIAAFGGSNNRVDVIDSVFEEIGRVGVLYFGASVNGAIFEGNTYTGKGGGNWLDYALDISAGADVAVSECTITRCSGVAASDGSTSAAVLVTTYYGGGTTASVSGSVITDNTTGIAVGYDLTDTSTVVAHNNAIYDNGLTTGIHTTSSVVVDATHNWWGDGSGPYDPNSDTLETVELGACTGDPATESNADGAGDFVSDTSTEVVGYCPWLTEFPRITLEPDASCYDNGATVTVDVWMRDILETIVGGQFFLVYDPSRLQFVSMAPGDAPFTQQISAAHPGDDGAGTIDYGVGVPSGGSGTNADTKMVTLTFTALTQICTEYDLITWRAHEPPSRLSNNLGGAVLPLLVNLNVDDDEAPSFAEAAGGLDVTVQCDDSTDPVDTGTPTPSDNCAMAAVDPLVWADVADLGGCNRTGTITRTWTATDSCGNTSTYVQVITVIDTTDPIVFCPSDVTVECDESTAPANTGVPTFEQGFETDTYGWFDYGGALTRLASGTNGVPSSAGGWHAETNGAFTRWGGYTTPFPGGGYTTSVDIYLDVSLGLANDTRMDYSSAINDAAGSHRRDFIYSAGFYNSADLTGPGAGTDRFVMSFSNNSPGWPKNPAFGPFVIDVSGWYRIEHRFYDSGGGVLAVDLNLYDSGGVLMNTWTLSNPADIIGSTVGGNRYGWFHNMGWALPVDNTVIRRGGSLAFDNCDAAPVVTSSDVETAGGCSQEKSIARTWTATDACGNSSSCVQTITVDDSVAPVLGACPADIAVSADAGGCTAEVTYTLPTATDNCDVAPTVTCDWPSGSAFPQGTTLVTCTASDDCGNESSCSFNVSVDAVNEMLVDVELAGVVDPGPFTRCITFELWACPDSGPAEIVQAELTFVNGVASDTVPIPCGMYTCVTARDELHTLRRSDDSFGMVGTQYVADFTDQSGSGGDNDSLLSGNHNDDFWIDILDFGVFTWQWGLDYGSGDTTCGTAFPHADVNGDGIVDNLEFSFIQIFFWNGHEANCCGAGGTVAAVLDGPVDSISVMELRRRGLGHLVIADLNRDGVLDHGDVAAFAAGVRPDLRSIDSKDSVRQGDRVRQSGR